MTATTTTEETSEIERFLAWRARLLKEHKDEPEWQEEVWAFFLDLYRQTYPARTFPFVMELWSYYQEVKRAEKKPMKTCVRAELKLPIESLREWLCVRFPELPPDTQIVGVYATRMPTLPTTVRFEVEHSHVDTDAEKEPKSDG